MSGLDDQHGSYISQNIPLFHNVTDNQNTSLDYNIDTNDDYSFESYYQYNLTDLEVEQCEVHRRLHVFRGIFDIFLVGSLILMGFIGNTITILVLRSDNVNKTVTFLLQSLAVVDNCYLLACLFLQPIKALTECTDWIPGLKELYPHWEPYAWAFGAISQTAAVWMVVLVTMDRYIAICHPFHVTRLCTLPRAKVIVTIVGFLAIIYNIPRFCEHEVYMVFDYCRKTFKLTTMHSDLRKNRIYFIIYKTFMYITFRVAIPFTTLFILNVKLFMILKEAMRNRATMTRSNIRQDSFTLILVSVVTVFLICEIPDAILRLLITVKHFNSSFYFDNVIITYINTITNFLLTLNSSVNCLIYCLTGRRFRLLLVRLLFRRCSDERKRSRQFAQCKYNDLGSRKTRWHDEGQTSNGPITNHSLVVACNDTTTTSESQQRETKL